MSWSSRGLRGSTFEEMINMTNELYMQNNLAVIQKIPTPITPVQLDNNTRTIKLAYFEKKSTVDYIGVIQGIPVCFDAKETTRKSLPLQNIHLHQIEFMRAFENQKGLSFLLVFFSFSDEYFYLPFDVLDRYWKSAETGGRKSIPYEAFDSRLRVNHKQGYMIHYLEAINTYFEIQKKKGLS